MLCVSIIIVVIQLPVYERTKARIRHRTEVWTSGDVSAGELDGFQN